MAPSITWAHHGADGGDLITAAYHLGIPHPPGYPLYVLIGYLFGQLEFLGGDVAFRFNLLSAICAAGAAGLLTVVIVRRAGLLGGWLGGLTFALGPIVWSQATITEVYTVNALLIAVLLLNLFSKRPRWVVIGFCWGLAWTTHLSSVFLFPLIIWVWRDQSTKRRKSLVYFGGGLLAGVALYLAVPLLASHRAPVSWGNPTTIEGWWWLVSAKLYRVYVFALPLSDWPSRLLALLRFAAQQLTFPGLLLALWGGMQLFDRERPFSVALFASSGLIAFYALGYNTADSHVLLIPVWTLLVILLGVGISDLAPAWPRLKSLAWLSLLIPAYLIFSGWSAANLSHDEEATTFAHTILTQAPADAVIYTAADFHTFTLWYYRFVENRRPDLTIVDKDLSAQTWYQLMLEVQDVRWVEGIAGRPQCSLSPVGELDCSDSF